MGRKFDKLEDKNTSVKSLANQFYLLLINVAARCDEKY